MSEAVTSSGNLRKKVYWWLERPDRAATGPRLLEIALIGKSAVVVRISSGET